MPRPASLLAVLTPDEVTKFTSGPVLAELRAYAPEYRQVDPTGLEPAVFAAIVADANPEVILACWRTPRLPAALPPRLRYVCYLTGSVKHLVTRAQLEAGLRVTNWGGAISRIVAECALFHTLCCLRHATRYTFLIHRERGWRDRWEEVGSLYERRVGIHGFGPVARALVELLRPFRCQISVFAPDVTDAVAALHGIRRSTSLDELFGQNDVIVELAPLIPATIGTVTERHLRLIRPGGVFVNVGRAAIVDEAALLRVAREGRITVGLDVFVEEPLPPNSGFRGLPNVSLSPHIAGPTLDRYGDATAFALRNLRAYAAGQPLEAVITPETYDHST
ncbi:MAG: hydroxyacid dehydrogenase [Verrucomicrobia bacterium]|nr:hydroxyacid dehydrogenase [Verrucomicrobiota bacterium]